MTISFVFVCLYGPCILVSDSNNDDDDDDGGGGGSIVTYNMEPIYSYVVTAFSEYSN